MRRQYHSIETPCGRLYWDVHRLVDLSKSLRRFQVPLDEIHDFENRSWFRESDPPPTHKEIALHAKLIEETNLAYPIILGADGRVMDGMHRICKAWLKGDATVLAVQFKEDPEPDYINVEEESLPYDEPW